MCVATCDRQLGRAGRCFQRGLRALNSALLSRSAQQALPGDDKIGQSKEQSQLRRVLPDSAITHLAEPEEVLHDMERMLSTSALALSYS